MDEYEIRAVAVEERRAVGDTVRTALLNGLADDATAAQREPTWEGCDALAAWEGERCVGNVGAFRFDSTVPGGARLTTAGVTRVGVLPTHTRRGILTRLMHQLLHDCRANGQVLATLHASETPIYRRFGFAIGSEYATVEIDSVRARPWQAPASGGSFRLLAHDEVLDVVPALYERVARGRVGTISRPAWWWRGFYEAATQLVSGRTKGTWVVVHTDTAGHDDGFAMYEVGWASVVGDHRGEGTVHDLWGATPEAELALWRYLLDVDLIKSWTVDEVAVDSPVRRAMHDPRAYRTVAILDDQWVRILDVDAALRARTYGPADRGVTLAVTDPMFPADNRTWTIDASGATRAASDAPVDATVDVSVLSAAYLGAVSWHDLVAAGRLDLADDALTRLDALFASHRTPFCGTGY